tara:strand:+ start:2919 stop:3533 length:615 start_codon:yes stop_codon:yes gene_type:complete
MTINNPVLVNNNAIPSTSPIPEIPTNYSNNIAENSYHFLKIFFLGIFSLLLIFNLYQYFQGEETLFEKVLSLVMPKKEEEEKPEPKAPEVKGSQLKEKSKKKKNDEKSMDVQELALIEKSQKIPEKELNKALQIQDSDKVENRAVPSPDLSSHSDIQTVKKTGYCFIGSDNGKRHCVSVKTGDKCMSGEIFPSMDICIHPNLRP